MSGGTEAAVQFGHVLLLAHLLRGPAADEVSQRLDRLGDQGQCPIGLRILAMACRFINYITNNIEVY